MDSFITDVFGLLMDEETTDESLGCMTADEALVECLNKFGLVDMKYLMKMTGQTAESLVVELRGVIFQDPNIFIESKEYDPTVGWILSENYLSGNVCKKLETARAAEKMFCGRFKYNIEALLKILPPLLTIDEIHINLGASWIPLEEYARFICDFLHLSEVPELTFSKELGRWEVKNDDKMKSSVLNTITYGVRGSFESGNDSYTRQYLTAVEIIVQTLNAKTIKVFDYIPTYRGRGVYDYEPVLNQNKTVEAQDKQKAIIDAFKDWVYADALRTERFEGYYNESLVGYTFSAYDGSFLRLPDLNPDVTFFRHQKDAVARVLLSGKNVLFAHDVGTGKTYEMIASVHELKRLGLSDKNLVVVPNNVLKATVDAHKHLYPDDKILVIFPKDFDPKNRNAVLESIRDGDYTAIYMAYSSFDMIVMSKAYYVDKQTAQIRAIRRAFRDSDSKRERNELRRKAESLTKKLTKYIAEVPDCAWLTFDKLGIKTLVLDEAHNYKNISVNTRAENIVGMSKKGSKKCCEMLEKAHFVDRLIFATGTPLTNSLADLFVFQVYLQPATLELHGISSFDAWVNTFGQRETNVECDVDANSKSLRTVTRFSSFHNLGELMGMFAQVCDFHHMDENDSDLPYFRGHTDICVQRSREQAAYIESLSERTEKIRAKKVKRYDDNLLKVTGDGRMAAVDIRLVLPDTVIASDEMTKIEACAKQVLKIYSTHERSAQVIFCDIGTPKVGFNVYDCLREKLVKMGIPDCEIAYIHEASTENARAKLFAAMNEGALRVVIGSTQKLGVGVNIQERLVALHHLSVPWKPSDMVQREGRILRKGNISKEIFMFRYITEGSFDAYSWQLLENKQKFISSFLSGTSAAREMDDIADAVLSYAEVKALAIGNPLIKKRVEVSNQLERQKIAGRARQKQMQELRAVIETTPKKIADTRRLASLAEADSKWFRSVKRPVTNGERNAFGEELLEALSDNVGKSRERLFDEYRGFSVILPANMTKERPFVLLRSVVGGEYYCEIAEDKTPLGCCKSIDYILEHLDKNAEKLYARADELKKRLSEAVEDLDKENPYIKEIKQLQDRLSEIDRLLENNDKEEKVS